MTYNINKNSRKSIRLKEYDYGQDGLYFITICIQNRKHLLGNIANSVHTLSDAGLMVESVWNDLSKHYKGIKTHEFVVMPNHIHGILELDSSDLDLPEVIRRFKTFTTGQYIKNVHANTWEAFDKKLWQRNYYEHIIRNEKSLSKLKNYIMTNPLKWEEDVLYD